MSNDLRRHYEALFETYGDSPKAVQHADAASQAVRFEILAGVMDSDASSVLDVGCGLGHLLDFLRARDFRGRYHGLDLVPAFIERARARHAHDPRATFQLLDVTREPLPNNHEYALLSGVFNNRMPDNEGFMWQTLRAMWAAANRGIAFNALTSYVDWQAPDLHYVDPRSVFDRCVREFTRRVTLRHDYRTRPDRPPYEFSIYLFK